MGTSQRFFGGLFGPGGSVSSSTNKPAVGDTLVRGTVPAGATATCKKNGTVQGSATVTAQGAASYTLNTPLVAGDQVSFPWTLTGESPAATVAATPTQLAISGANGTATVGDTASFTPTISGGTAPYSVTATGLPPGRAIANATTGLTTGAYTTAGSYGATYTVADSLGATASFTRLVVVSALQTLNTLYTSGLLTNGVPSFGVINGATDGSTVTSNLTGLTVNSAARTYSWDGTGAAGTTAAALTETPVSGAAKTSQAIVLPAHTGTLRPSGRQFFGGEPAMFLINAGYAATSSLTVTSSDGTVFTVGVNSQGYPLAIGTFPTVTQDTPVKLSITELKSDSTTAVSEVWAMVSPIPPLPTAAETKIQAQRVVAAVSGRKPIVVGPNPPTISINTGNSTVNGRTLASGSGAIGNNLIPEGQSGLGGIPTQGQAAGAFIIGDTTNGLTNLTWPNGCSRRFKFDGSHFDFRFGFSGTPPAGTAQVQVLYTEEADTANPQWYAATAKASTYKLTQVSQWFDVQFSGPPARPGARAVEIFFQQNTSITGFNFETSVTPVAYSDSALTGGAWNDSFDYGQGTNDTGFFGLSGHMAMEALGSRNVYAFGHRTAAWARLAGTAGVGSYTADRIISAPFGFDEATRFGLLDVMYGHMSINDPIIGAYTAAATTTKFVNQNSNFVPGTDTLRNLITLAYRRMRRAQRRALIVIDCGFTGPPDVFSSAYVTTLRDLFAKCFDTDPLAVFADFTNGNYRWMGQTFSTPTIPSPPLVPAGVAGTSPFFPPTSPVNITGSVTGDQLTVTAINTSGGRIEVGSVLPTIVSVGNGVARVASFNSGTTGGVGTYTLEYAPGDISSQTIAMGNDTQHPNAVGAKRWGQERGAAASFLATKAAALQ